MTYELKSEIAQTLLKTEGLYRGAVDGLWGPKSEAAAQTWRDKKFPPSGGGDFILDERSAVNVATLLPKAQDAAIRFMKAAVPAMAAAGAVVKIISGTRTYEEQDALFAQGRVTTGKIVTNARGGHSNHNFGIAWDIGIFVGGKYLEDSYLYRECAKIGAAQGLECGADWTFSDEPHFQLKTGLTTAELSERVAKGQAIV